MIMNKGRMCIITRGSDAGKKVVIKEVVDKNFVIISGEHVKERRSNVKHLEPISEVAKAVKTKEIKKKEKKAKLKKTKRVKTGAKKKAKRKASSEKPEKKVAKKETKEE